MKQFSLSASNGNATPNVAAKGETLLIWSNWNLFIIYRAWNGALSGYFKTFGIVWFNKRPISPSNCWIRFFSIAPSQPVPSYCINALRDCVTSLALTSSFLSRKNLSPSPTKWLLFPTKPNLKHFRFSAALGQRSSLLASLWSLIGGGKKYHHLWSAIHGVNSFPETKYIAVGKASTLSFCLLTSQLFQVLLSPSFSQQEHIHI